MPDERPSGSAAGRAGAADDVATAPQTPDPRITTGGRWADLTASWGSAARLGGLIWLVFTILRYLTAAIVEYVFQANHGRLHLGLPGVLSLPFTFDSAYFAEIANNGYFGERSSPTWPAFFPGYALAMRVTSLALTFDVSWGRLVVAGALISAACSLITTIVVFRLAQDVAGRRAGACAALLLMA